MLDSLGVIIIVAHICAVVSLYAGFITTITQSKIAIAAIEAIARQPESSGNVTTTMFIGLAMAETSGIYGLLIAIILLFANPLITIYLQHLT